MTDDLAYVRSSLPAYDEGLTIGDLFRQAADAAPERVALIFKDIDLLAGDRRWTYRQMREEVEAMACFLAARFQAGDRIAVWAHNCPEWPMVQYATALAGLILVAVSPTATAHELAYVLTQSQTNGLVVGRWTKGPDRVAAALAARDLIPTITDVLILEDLLDMARSCPAVAVPFVDPNGPAMIQYSSGTTGVPKGALLRHAALVNTTRGSERVYGLEPGSVWLNDVPMYNTAGAAMCSLNCLWNRGTHLLLRQFDPLLVIHSIASERANLVPMVPTMALAVLDHPACATHDLSSLEIVVTGGAPVPPDLIRRVEQELGADCIQVFGMTEVSSILSMNRRGDTMQHRCETIGYPLGGMEVTIVSVETGETMRRGDVGELLTRGHGVMMGYYNMPEETSAAIRNGWLHTGDLARILDDGYVQIAGRLKEMIIRGGNNVYPREIEEVLARHPAVDLCAIFGLPDPYYGERVCAAICLKPGASTDSAALEAFLSERIARYKVPSAFHFIDSMPMSAMNKIQKVELQRRFSAV